MMSESQIQEQQRFIHAEKKKVTPKRDYRKEFRQRFIQRSYDPAHLID